MFHWTIHLKGGHRNYYHAAVVDGHKLYSFGGYYNYKRDQIEVHIFNTLCLRWMKLSPVTNGRGQRPTEVPSGRQGHTAVLVEDIAYIWGDILTAMCFMPLMSTTTAGTNPILLELFQ